ESLPPIYRSVFILRAVEEASVDETARCLEVSDAVVRTRYLRARAMLRESIGQQVEMHAPDALQFAGARCDAVVNHVLAELARAGAASTTKEQDVNSASFFGSDTGIVLRRRAILAGTGVLSAGALALLGGCEALAAGPKSKGGAMASDPEADVRILNTALGAELEAVAAYQVGAESGLLQKDVLTLAGRFQGHHKEHAEALAATVEKLGGRPVAAKARY